MEKKAEQVFFWNCKHTGGQGLARLQGAPEMHLRGTQLTCLAQFMRRLRVDSVNGSPW